MIADISCSRSLGQWDDKTTSGVQMKKRASERILATPY